MLSRSTRQPVIVQGGTGVGVSSWRLAQAVARTGQLGVVSGTALDVVVSRRLQDGDPGGHVRRALYDFPLPAVAEQVLARYFRPGGRRGVPYLPLPRPALRRAAGGDELTVVSTFVEVWLAKEGHSGQVGISCPEKIQLSVPASVYGALLAGADHILAGTSISGQIPRLLDDLSAQRPGTVHVDVAGGVPHPSALDPASLGGNRLPPLRRPSFLATVPSHALTDHLDSLDHLGPARSTRPDGFVVESPLGDDGLAALTDLGLPFWLAGGCGEPERVRAALAAGASGVQVGTLFTLSLESGLDEPVREGLLQELRSGTLRVRTDVSASPDGLPLTIASLKGTLSEPEVYDLRPRLCDLGYLRTPYRRGNGSTGYRCPAEPVDVFLRKGGAPKDAAGARCLCNALLADVGLGQRRRSGYGEVPLVILGADLAGARRLDAEHWLHGGSAAGWSAAEAVAWLLREVGARG